jgi:hypothetical protein
MVHLERLEMISCLIKKNCSPLQVLFKAKAFQTEKEINFDLEAQDIAIAGSTNIKMSHSEPD